MRQEEGHSLRHAHMRHPYHRGSSLLIITRHLPEQLKASDQDLIFREVQIIRQSYARQASAAFWAWRTILISERSLEALKAKQFRIGMPLDMISSVENTHLLDKMG